MEDIIPPVNSTSRIEPVRPVANAWNPIAMPLLVSLFERHEESRKQRKWVQKKKREASKVEVVASSLFFNRK